MVLGWVSAAVAVMRGRSALRITECDIHNEQSLQSSLRPRPECLAKSSSQSMALVQERLPGGVPNTMTRLDQTCGFVFQNLSVCQALRHNWSSGSTSCRRKRH
jgi:hypothetical protein